MREIHSRQCLALRRLERLFGTMELLFLTSFFFAGVPGLFTDIQLDVIDGLGCPQQVLFEAPELFCRR